MDGVHMGNQETQILGRKALSEIVQTLQSYKEENLFCYRN